MIAYPTIDPVMLAVGPIQIRWYGMMYVLGFAAAYLLVLYQAKRFHWQQIVDRLDDLHLFLIIGVVIGGRLGYVLFYNLSYYLAHPLAIPALWTGGMSFHGGCLGAILAGVLCCRRMGLNFWKAADLFIVAVPIGLFFGRLGNFINGELFGRITTVPWGMIFPEGGPLPRHPSQLYEALLEGLTLFAILWAIKAKPWQQASSSRWPHGSVLILFLGLYGCVRFLVEFVREPDPQIGLIGSALSMGQLLCLVMIIVAPLLWWWRCRQTAKGGTR
ncbi:MAG: prolipoprotein diacylglyceryl transferase [Desulfobulbus sp.]|nr:prolipoprotein diacylglyceryl transferase [Desulfobulbus sp.]